MKDTAEFVSDISVPGMIRAVTIRSPAARSRLAEIKCPVLPESYRLITAEHIPGKNSLADFSVPVLAEKDLSYIGQPVALLAGPDISVLEELASEIKIIAGETDNSPPPDDAVITREIRSGDTDKALAESLMIVSGTYAAGIQEHWYAEPHGALAAPSSGGCTIYTATQWPFHVRNSAARVLGWKNERVTVSPCGLAVHLDGKLWYPSLVACHAALAAWITGSPVKLTLAREEDFRYSPKRNRAAIDMRSALGEDGSLSASIIQLRLDLGADAVMENEIMDHTCLGALGAYNHGAVNLNGVGLRTNIPPQGPMAGFGLSQGFFAAERHISRVADALGQDPAEWRKNNALKKGQSLAGGIPLLNSVPLARLIDAAAASSGYRRKWASYELLRSRRRKEKWEFPGEPLRGIGIAAAYQGNGLLHYNALDYDRSAVEIILHKDVSLEIKTSVISPGLKNIWRNMAREILGLAPDLIRFTHTTAEAPDSGPETLSRNIGLVTALVEKCCLSIRGQRLRGPLPIAAKHAYRPAKRPVRSAPAASKNTEMFADPSWAAAVAEIEIDPVSIEPLIRGIWLVVDGGKILSPPLARRTLRTGIIQALGWTCREQIRYEEGQIPPELYHGYDIHAPADCPPISVDFIQSDTPGPKGIGDLPFCCVPAAYVQAVSQAVDHPFEKIPLDARSILDALKLKQTEGAQ